MNDDGRLLWLGYARLGPDHDEPRIACDTRLPSLRVLLDDVVSRRPDVEVRWESVPLDGPPGAPTLHLVSVGAPDNPVGIAAFDSAGAAMRFAAARPGEDCIVEEVGVGVVDQWAVPRPAASADLLADREQGAAEDRASFENRSAERGTTPATTPPVPRSSPSRSAASTSVPRRNRS